MQRPDGTDVDRGAGSAAIAGAVRQGALPRMALPVTTWSERWLPEPFVFTALAVLVVAAAALSIGSRPQTVVVAFGTGFWSLITVTMQMRSIVVLGSVAATSPPFTRRIDALARVPRTGRGAVAYISLVSMPTSLLNWALSLVFAGLLVRAVARRDEPAVPALPVCRREAGAHACVGVRAGRRDGWRVGWRSR
jgi:short-chain fatty acids transporter